MARDEFAKTVGKNMRKTSAREAVVMYPKCVSVSPISISGADMPIPVATNRGINFSGLSVGDTLIVLKVGNKMVCTGYF